MGWRISLQPGSPCADVSIETNDISLALTNKINISPILLFVKQRTIFGLRAIVDLAFSSLELNLYSRKN